VTAKVWISGKGAVLDIAPTLTMYDDTSKEFATLNRSRSGLIVLSSVETA
jgi:hypothetical protein